MYPMYIGKVNHEYRDTSHTNKIWMIHTGFDNVTNTSRIISMDPNKRLLLSLTHIETRLIPYNLSVNKTRYNRVEFLFFKEEVPGFVITGCDRINASYRNLHLILGSDEEEEGGGNEEGGIIEQIITTS